MIKKISESLSSITKNLEEFNESTRKLGDIIKESNSAKFHTQEVVSIEIDSEDDHIQCNIKPFQIVIKFLTI